MDPRTPTLFVFAVHYDQGLLAPGRPHLRIVEAFDPDPYLESSNLAIVMTRHGGGFEAIGRRVVERCADLGAVTVWFDHDAPSDVSADLFARRACGLEALSALAAIAAESGWGLSLAELRLFGPQSAMTGAGAAGSGGPWFAAHLLFAAIEDIGWSRERLSRAYAFVVVVTSPVFEQMRRELPSVVEPLRALIGPDPMVHVAYRPLRQAREVRVHVLAFEHTFAREPEA